MAKTRRYCGFCTNPGCTAHYRTIFVMGRRACWHCPRCMNMGRLVEERCWAEGPSEGLFTTARLHFDYDPREERFRQIAIVDNLASPALRVLVIESPIIRSEKAALALTERLLGAVQHTPVGSDPVPFPDAHLTSLDLDEEREVFCGRLKGWQRGIEQGLLPGISS